MERLFLMKGIVPKFSERIPTDYILLSIIKSRTAYIHSLQHYYDQTLRHDYESFSWFLRHGCTQKRGITLKNGAFSPLLSSGIVLTKMKLCSIHLQKGLTGAIHLNLITAFNERK